MRCVISAFTFEKFVSLSLFSIAFSFGALMFYTRGSKSREPRLLSFFCYF